MTKDQYGPASYKPKLTEEEREKIIESFIKYHRGLRGLIPYDYPIVIDEIVKYLKNKGS